MNLVIFFLKKEYFIENGVAERKNRHLLEVARSIMFTMNVPKFLWSEAVMTA